MNAARPSDESLARLWLGDARPELPDEHSWAIFVAKLRMAAVREQHDPADERYPEGLQSVAAVVEALHALLESHPATAKERLSALTARLMMAIADVSEGRHTPLFQPTFKGQTRKRAVQANVAAIAARAVDELLETGMSLDEAARKVSSAARKGRVAGYSTCDAARVKNWRARLQEGEGAVTREALLRYQAELPESAGRTPAIRADFLLTALRDSPALRFG